MENTTPKKPEWEFSRKFDVSWGENMVCSVCGTPIIHIYSFKNLKTDEIKLVGIECFKKLTGYTKKELEGKWKEYNGMIEDEETKLRIEKEKIIFHKANKKIVDKLIHLKNKNKHHEVLDSICEQYDETGFLSDKQMGFIDRIKEEKFDNLISEDEYWELYHLTTPLIWCNLDRFSEGFYKSIMRGDSCAENIAVCKEGWHIYGISRKQKDALIKIVRKYRKQIKGELEKFDSLVPDNVKPTLIEIISK